MSWFTVGWLVLLVAAVALEVAALANPAKGDTLSEHIWWLYKLPGYGTFAAWMITAFILWAVLHFLWPLVQYLRGAR